MAGHMAEGVGMLFGHQNDQNDDASQPASAPVPGPNVNPLAVDPATGASLPTVQTPEPEMVIPSVLNQPTTPDPVMAAPIEPLDDTAESVSAPLVVEPSTTPETPEVITPSVESTPPTPTAMPAAPSNDALLALKQQALTQLSPLVDQLDQSPEERFRTTMMMIQSTDNQSLIQSAYDAAQAITDEKVRAQALLDVINEINYFTQQSQQSTSSN